MLSPTEIRKARSNNHTLNVRFDCEHTNILSRKTLPASYMVSPELRCYLGEPVTRQLPFLNIPKLDEFCDSIACYVFLGDATIQQCARYLQLV